MPTSKGCGILFFDAQNQSVLLVRRDNKPGIIFPDCMDILGGFVEEGESAGEAVVREMAEELDDLRTRLPFKLEGHRIFKVYTDEWGIEQHIFWKIKDFDVQNVWLNEGQALIWLTEEELSQYAFALGFDEVVREFFAARK
jgi:8-oxo-dGTP diphosphatase